uniref:NADH-ubiquinone oxidoreductase chain 6 n=1 Tax=Antarctoperla michaelseni TaxID=1778585 RepID=A0A482JP77_9NEOP|nr:NADH dehydrogenase subunit 6 [Antarctoperla michaelseni]QBP33880.1 NADH dehydrogenase subunit 6 [Antarctoperla michaelseni]
MLQTIIMGFSLFLSLIFTQMNHPLAMGMMLLLQTLVICLMTGLMAKSFWFSYILFLVFLGGLLVLFIYVTSLASNEMFSLSTKMIIYLSGPVLILIMISLTTDLLPILNNYMNSDLVSILSSLNYQEEAALTLYKLYNEPTSFITLMLVVYLFLTLIAVVKITDIFSGPLREKN